MEESMVWGLLKLSTPQKYAPKELICYEGQPGEKMYFVLKGKVGVFVTSAVNTLIETEVVGPGDSFEEMAIFDHLPYSASCIAMEETICVAITQDMLKSFILTCPDMVVRLFEKLSGRIRRLNDELYKSVSYVKNTNSVPFFVPETFCKSHEVKEPKAESLVLQEKDACCPVCGKRFFITNIKRNLLSLSGMDKDRRPRYVECEPLWHEIFHCPYCHYSNHYLKFFSLIPTQTKLVRELLEKEQVPAICKLSFVRTLFDRMIVYYLQAIHINEVLNSENRLMIGKLWMNLYWLAQDSGDEIFGKECARTAAAALSETYKRKEKLGLDEVTCQSITIMLASLYMKLRKKEEVLKYCREAALYSDKKMKATALVLKREAEESIPW